MYVYQMKYWDKIVDYYYDNIHWRKDDISPTTSITKWIKDEFFGIVDWENQIIHFDDPKHLSWFVLKWS